MRKGIFRCANKLQERVDTRNQPLHPLFQLAARAAGIQADKTDAFVSVGISRHDGDFLLLNQYVLQGAIVNI